MYSFGTFETGEVVTYNGTEYIVVSATKNGWYKLNGVEKSVRLSQLTSKSLRKSGMKSRRKTVMKSRRKSGMKSGRKPKKQTKSELQKTKVSRLSDFYDIKKMDARTKNVGKCVEDCGDKVPPVVKKVGKKKVSDVKESSPVVKKVGKKKVPEVKEIPPIETIIGDKVGKFPVIKFLGSGQYGSVFETVLENGTPAAVKVVVDKHLTDEYRVLSRLEDLNTYVPKMYMYDKFTQGAYKLEYLVIEKFKYSLKDLNESTKLSKSNIFGIGVRLLKALKLMKISDTYSVAHLDIKPDNIMMTDDPERGICLVDFGISELYCKGHKYKPRPAIDGTPSFMSVHVWNLEPLSLREDLESVGYVVAWLLLGGTLPWYCDEQEEKGEKIKDPNVPEELAKLCKEPVIGEYLSIVRNLKIDDEIPYDALIKMFEAKAGKSAKKLTY